MSRLLSHLLLLLYAGIYLHCQPLSTRANGTATAGSHQQEQRGGTLCRKKLQTVQATPPVESVRQAKAKLLPLDGSLSGDFAALYFGLLFPACQPAPTPVRGPSIGPAQALANHPNKAPPIRFS
ncbi:hypothetical protein LRS06_24125 [Hymenobacter sp. J193]|uniref:hypothetical protein n=1 Tax=Hymenobacter sp. J193 TaxID=2898429 RepID=UPI002151769A|nr:hypothetical protein [Hymenobacter sp. J193]MCR5890713.1 hypothetical protein [Hymenobacter sp. J193]MCR5890817.1 hypothetical protein [Hymenobacter sp. J193]